MKNDRQEFSDLVFKLTQGRRNMDADEERQCVMIVQQYWGDKDHPKYQDALSTLIQFHTVYLAKIVLAIANYVQLGSSVEYADLLQIAITKFIEKLDPEKFNIESGNRLTTYYTRDVRTAVARAIADMSLPVRQGTPLMQQIAYRVARASDAMAKSSEHEVSMDDVITHVAEDMEHSEEFVRLALVCTRPEYTSLDEPGADLVQSLPGVDGEREDFGDLLLEVLQQKLPTQEPVMDIIKFLQTGQKLSDETIMAIKRTKNVTNT